MAIRSRRRGRVAVRSLVWIHLVDLNLSGVEKFVKFLVQKIPEDTLLVVF